MKAFIQIKHMNIKATIVSFIALLCIQFNLSAQNTNIRGFNEVSATIGVGSALGGSATPDFSVLYTRGWHIGDYLSAGLCAGFDFGLSAQVLLRGMIPFGKGVNTGGYLSGQGGVGCLMMGAVPLVSISMGLFHRFGNRTQLIVGPMVKSGFMCVDSVNNEKAWGAFIGIKLGYEF